MFSLFAGTSHWSYIGFLRRQKMLYEFLALTNVDAKRCYMSFWCQHNVDAKRFYIRFGVNILLTLKDINCRKKVLFFTSTRR
jgi:lysine/ornithine N-monooxygenase